MKLKLILIITSSFSIAGPTHSKKIEIPDLPKAKESYIVIADQKTLLTRAQEQKIDKHILIQVGFLNKLANQRITESQIEETIDSAVTEVWQLIEKHLKSKRPRSFEQHRNKHYLTYLNQYDELKPDLIQIVRNTAKREEIEV